ncbi:MAG: outer membrane lipid asymmetry maintenance protein MlaD [Alphaproteobacteria bacterium]|nr:outer membrane lipid asymmetry maintenance protein MlaD [Alphaproteobacteria bacterium]
MKRSVIETVLGGVVLLVAAVFFIFAYSSSNIRPVDGYTITARFNSVDGLVKGSDARIGGVRVGTVTNMSIDQEAFQAVVTLSIQKEIRLPEDTLAVVSSDGLLGGKYVRLEPGNSSIRIGDNGEVKKTKDVVSLEEMLGKVIFLVADEGGS